MRRKEGITLIASVATVIVLIVLAGVSIELLLGENGIITKARNGKENHKEAKWIEEKILEGYEELIDSANENMVLSSKYDIEKEIKEKQTPITMKLGENIGLNEENAKTYQRREICFPSKTANINFKIEANEYTLEEASDKWVILVHGYTGSKEGFYDTNYNDRYLVERYLKEGYNILVPEMRYSYQYVSNPETFKLNTWGWLERLDLLDCINYLICSKTNPKIIVHGFSEGAATVSMLSGEKLPTQVKGIIADSSYIDFKTEIREVLRGEYKSMAKEYMKSMTDYDIDSMTDEQIEEFMIGYIEEYLKTENQIDFHDISAINQVKKAKTALLFMHGTEDKLIHPSHSQRLYEAATNSKYKELHYQEGYDHCAAVQDIQHETGLEQYWNIVSKFLEKINKI